MRCIARTGRGSMTDDSQGNAPDRPGRWQGAGALIFNDIGEVLLIRQHDGGRFYSLPGGAIEPGEMPHAAAIREVLEEAGVQIRLERLVGLYTAPAKGRWLAFVFLGVIERGQPRLVDPEEIAEVGWFDAEQLPDPLYDSALYAMRDAGAGAYGVLRDIHVSD